FVGQNPPTGAQLYYTLPKKAEKVSLKVLDIEGAVVTQLTPPPTAGLHRISWDLTRGAARQGAGRFGGTRTGSGRQAATPPATSTESAAQPPSNEETPVAPPALAARPMVPPGAYRVVLTVDGKEFAQSLRVEGDP